MDFATGEISGTPTATSSSATYTITARNSGGTGTTTVTIVVNDAVPVIAYSPSSFTLTKGTAMTTVTPNRKRWSDRLLVNFANVTNRPCL